MHLNFQKISPNPSHYSALRTLLFILLSFELPTQCYHSASNSRSSIIFLQPIELWAKSQNMNSFRAVNTISRRTMTSGVHQPFAIKPKFKVPKSAGMAVSNLCLDRRCACILFIIWHACCCSVSDYIHTAQLSTSLCTSYLLHITPTAHAPYILYLQHRIWKQNCGH